MLHDIGFTGTKRGLNPSQRAELDRILKELKRQSFTRLRHGDCIGADAEAHELARANFLSVALHPPIYPKYRANCHMLPGEEVNEPKDYLFRNRDIVDNSAILIVCSGDEEEVLRSGTWATARYARSIKKPHIIIYPTRVVSIL